MHTFSVGEVLKRSFSIWLKNLLPFTLMTTLMYLPLVVYTWMVFGAESFTLSAFVTWTIAVAVGSLLLGQLATGAITYGVIQQLRGQHAGIGKCLSVGLSRLLPVLAVGILVGICVGLGLLLLIVPGIILLCMMYVAVPVAVIERPGVIGAMKRSAELTKGYKGAIFGVLFVIGIIEKVSSKVLESAFVDTIESVDDLTTLAIVVLVLTIALGTLRSVTNAVAYHDLRLTKEGVDVEQLAAVFE